MFSDYYRVIGSKELAECHGTGVWYEHKATGARVFTLKNEDPNKVFMIGFRTAPKDSTGVAHIMEHSVLCGSEKFPLKDPFVELVKGSLNTFLNAMTYPDKTVYPVASCNEKDFMNLMDVYLDAVFHPCIYREKKIFLQEGWHYETEENGALKYNGVVYNEMKGVFSNADSVLERLTLNSLFPHTVYGNESGGDPDHIPDLSYGDFLDFHRTYYHPSNSYIYLYGNMDMEEKLLWIHENYLHAYERKKVESEIHPEPAFPGPVTAEREYAVLSAEEEDNHAYLSDNFAIPEVNDSMTDLAWEIIDFVLFGAPGAVLKEELMQRGFGEEVYGGYNAGLRQPYFSVVAKNTSAEKLPQFLAAVREILQKTVKEGFDRTSLKAALNYLEFKYREEDFGKTPAGLEYGLNAMESWLYDKEPWLFLTYNEEFDRLKKLIGTGYFEHLLAEAVIGNPHEAVVTILPKAGLQEKKDADLKKKLEKLRLSMSGQQLQEIKEQEKELLDWQGEEDSEEQKRCLPVLALSDIGVGTDKILWKLKDRVIFTELPTNGIAYVRLVFDVSGFSEKELQYLTLLKCLLGELNTAKHSYKQLSDEILLKTGGLCFSTGSYSLDWHVAEQTPFMTSFTADLRVLSGNIGEALKLVFEIMEQTDLSDEKRILEKMTEIRSLVRSGIEDFFPHSAAVSRAMSYRNAQDRCSELTGGFLWYDFLCGCIRETEKNGSKTGVFDGLAGIVSKLKDCRFDAALAGNEAMLEEMNRSLGVLGKDRQRNDPGAASHRKCTTIVPVSMETEGIITGSMVNYVARTGRYLEETENYSGAVEVLKGFLSYEYLWTTLRVKGGAYGAMCGFRPGGRGYFVSYRDPNLEETDSVYEKLPAWLETADITGEKVRKYIIGAIAAQDVPVTASVKAERQLGYYYSGITAEELQKRRWEILQTTPEQIRAFAPKLKHLTEEGSVCVIGGKEAILQAGDFFRTVREIKGENS